QHCSLPSIQAMRLRCTSWVAESLALLRHRCSRIIRTRIFRRVRSHSGEQPREAAARELHEETGLSVTVGRKLWQKTFTLELPQGLVNQHEEYFLVRSPDVTPRLYNSSSESIREHRWWSLAELQSTSEVIYPECLARDLQALL